MEKIILRSYVMNPTKILKKYYKGNKRAFNILIKHSRLVQKKALSIAKSCKKTNLDLNLIREGSLLHDIGIIQTNAPGLHCYGKAPYIQHGVLGGKILMSEGFPKHAQICERHTGMGITYKEIISNKLPLPKKNLVPISIEEKIICLADKFYSKNLNKLSDELSIDEIRNNLAKYGKDKVEIFEELLKKFNLME